MTQMPAPQITVNEKTCLFRSAKGTFSHLSRFEPDSLLPVGKIYRHQGRGVGAGVAVGGGVVSGGISPALNRGSISSLIARA